MANSDFLRWATPTDVFGTSALPVDFFFDYSTLSGFSSRVVGMPPEPQKPRQKEEVFTFKVKKEVFK